MKGWGDSDSADLLDRLLAMDGEVQILHMVHGIATQRAKALLPWRNRQANLPVPSAFKAAEFDQAIELVQGDRDAVVEHQLTLFVHADSIERLDGMIATARRAFADAGMSVVIEGAASEWLWRCRLPGFDMPVRPRTLLAQNLASLLSFEQEAAGDERCDWGEGPIRLFRSLSGGAYSLQLHVSDKEEALGHSLTVAPSSSGKTTLWQHLIGGALRHRDLAAYAFDRHQGMRIFTEAVGGRYIDVLNGQAVALNPLQMTNTAENRQFLHHWLLQLAGVDDDESYEAASRAVDAIFRVRKRGTRSLDAVADSAFDTGTAFKAGMARWLGDGPGSWFNGRTDSLDLERGRLVAFEMAGALDDPRVAAALVSYVMHRIRSVCRAEARPHLVLIDETAPMLEDALFRKHVEVLFREHRKLRGSVNVVFQDVGALLKSGIAEPVLNQCPTRFVFPNPNARREDYAALDLTESQWDYVKGTSRLARGRPHSVLLKRGQEAVILDVDLTPLGPYLRLYRSGSEPVLIVKELQAKWGMDKWIGEYLS